LLFRKDGARRERQLQTTGDAIPVTGDEDIYAKWWNWFYCNYETASIPVDSSCPPADGCPAGYRFLVTDSQQAHRWWCSDYSPNTRTCTIPKGTKVVIPTANKNVVSDLTNPLCCDSDTIVTLERDVVSAVNDYEDMLARIDGTNVPVARYFSSDFYDVDYTLDECPNGWDPLGTGGLQGWYGLHDGYWMETTTFNDVGTYTLEAGGQGDDGKCFATMYEITVVDS